MTGLLQKISRIIPYLWIAILGLTLLLSVQNSYRKSLNTEEFAFACDSFGYLRMAKEIRQAVHERELPDFKLESPQTRLLINFMQSQSLPVPVWEEVVAPHAHHYFPQSNYVGVQYPPGTGLVLAIFPEGKAVYNLNRTVVTCFLLVGIATLGVAVWKRAWASAGLVILALHLGLSILERMGSLSFSINAVLIPLLFACLIALTSLRLQIANRNRAALLAALGSGLVLGFAVLVRLPVMLLVPGFLILLWPRQWRIGLKSLPVAFAFGLVLTGVIPVLLHQQVIAGAWYLPTYASVDAALPTIERVGHNLKYFFNKGPAARDNWALFYALLGFIGFVMLLHHRREPVANRFGLTWRRLGLAALMMWLLPMIFFITHWVVGEHYAIPGIFATIALLGFGSLAIETTSAWPARRFNSRNLLSWLAVGLVLCPGLAALDRARLHRTSIPAASQPITHPPIVLPAELADARAWIWADLLTGSLWYYANKPAYKIQFTNPETRTMIFRFVFERGEPQYVIQDSEQMPRFMDEIVKLGGSLELKGKIDGHNPYFLVHWPAQGPTPPAVAQN